MYKISNYNYYVNYNNRIIYYNSISDKIFILKLKEHAILQKLFNDISLFKKKYSEIFSQFIEWNFIVNKKTDELSVVKNTYLKTLNDESSFFLTINPTLDCILDCWYCFVHEYVDKVKNTKMQQYTVDNINRLIERNIENEKIKNIHLNWFGGEPFMFYKDVFLKIISNYLKVNHDKNITNSITTNGYLINDEIISDLLKINISTIQITIDGAKKRHNSIRYTNNNIGTYDKIIKNIHLIANKLINTQLQIRINYDYETLKDIDTIISDLNSINKTNVLIDLQRVWQIEQNEELSLLLEKSHDKFRRNGFNTRIWAFKPKRNYHCPYDKKNAFVVNYDGKIHKCVSRNYENEVGIINNDSLQLNENYYTHSIRTALDLPKCMNCKEFPLCFGPCLQKISETKNNENEELCVLNHSEMTVETYIKKRADEILTTINI